MAQALGIEAYATVSALLQRSMGAAVPERESPMHRARAMVTKSCLVGAARRRVGSPICRSCSPSRVWRLRLWCS